MRIAEEFRIGLRYTLTGRHDRFVSFVSLMSAAGIALGVAALIVVLAVMNGFHQELRSRILSVASHLEVIAFEGTIADWQRVGEAYLEHPSVLSFAPQVQEQALLIGGSKTQGALVRGIVPDYEVRVSELKGYMEQGDLNDLVAGEYRVVLGRKLAANLRAEVGDEVILVSPQGRLTAAGFYPRLRRLEVAGIFSSGLYQYDSGLAYLHIADAEKIYRLAGPTSIRLQLVDLLQAPAMKEELQDVQEGVYLYDWTSSHGGLFRALALERRVMFIILMLIIAVAAFNIVSALVTMVRNKRGDIAILLAMGAGRSSIVRIFLFQGTIIGAFGVVVGVMIGLPIAYFVGDIVGFFESVLHRDLFPGSVYHLDKLPSIVSVGNTLQVACLAFVLSLLAAIYPAWQAGRLLPAEALRYE